MWDAPQAWPLQLYLWASMSCPARHLGYALAWLSYFYSSTVIASAHLHVGKVHFGMLFLELLEDVELLLLVAGGLARLLLPLIVHHLLDHAPRLSIEVAQLAVLGLDLAGVDLGRRGDDMGPPLHLVLLVQVNFNVFASGCGAQRPGRVVDTDGVGKFALAKHAG
jgi:hypothetical protein